MRRALLLALIGALMCLALPAAAVAEPCSPSYDGSMSFSAIDAPDDPEEFCWELDLAENQELRQVDDQHAGVFYTESGYQAFSITAELAHDAEGTEVPTTLAVVEPNVIVLTVHHRDGDPTAGGAPFDYPVVAGAGWEGGFQSVEIVGPPDESELRPKPSPAPTEESRTPACEVPILQGRTLKSARRALLRAGCQLGPIRGHRSRGARIVKQYRPAFKTVPLGTAVGVKLGR